VIFKKYKIFLAAIILLLVSCSANLKVYSDPEYATIYVNGRNFGRTPVELNYKLNREDKKKGFIYIGNLNARWLSGAETSVFSIYFTVSTYCCQMFKYKTEIITSKLHW
jgi:hypothetical protein